eukprot:gene16292-4959_t
MEVKSKVVFAMQCKSCLELLFSWGLTPELFRVLMEVQTYCPPTTKEATQLQTELQITVMNLVSYILSGLPFSAKDTHAISEIVQRTFLTVIDGQKASKLPKAQTVALALQVLGQFHWSHKQIWTIIPEFLAECVVRYLDDEDPAIRKEAVIAVSTLTLSPRRFNSSPIGNDSLGSQGSKSFGSGSGALGGENGESVRNSSMSR